MNLIFCGLPRSGKTTLGKLTAKRLCCPFVDLDELILTKYRQTVPTAVSCRQIVIQEGEAYFRRLEKEAVAELKPNGAQLIALGGGTLSDQDNLEAVKRMGPLVYLKVPPVLIWKRLKDNGIPAYLDETDPETHFYAIAAVRTALFEREADVVVETEGKGSNQIIREILSKR